MTQQIRESAAEVDLRFEDDPFRKDILEGLAQSPKRLPSKYFYDERGSQLFEEICELEEYYVTRTELSIMHAHVKEMAEAIGPNALLVEYGSGASVKTKILLQHLQGPVGYVPIDISEEFLLKISESLQEEFPDLEVHPLAQDYTAPIHLPVLGRSFDKIAAYFPGSTLGNFEPDEALEFIRSVRKVVDNKGAFLLGVDLVKNKDVLERAYDDSQGVTAAFNLNLIERINKEFGMSTDLNQFEHIAFFNEAKSRIEMHLRSKMEQEWMLDEKKIYFKKGEEIITEYSHKFTIGGITELALAAGFATAKCWTDDKNYFAIFYLVAH